MKKVAIKLDRPVYCGVSVLDLSKHLMYDYYYNTIKAKYGDKAELCFTDTDSFLMDIQSDDLPADLKEDREKYDFSNYSPTTDLFSNTNKKVVGKFKDECGGRQIRSFCGLR